MFPLHLGFLFFRHYNKGPTNMPQKSESFLKENLSRNLMSNGSQWYFRVNPSTIFEAEDTITYLINPRETASEIDWNDA